MYNSGMTVCRQGGLRHLEVHHPGDEGLVNLNIFCRFLLLILEIEDRPSS